MNSISETGRPFALLNYETFAFWAYTVGVATTAFGPIAHYIGWTFALASLIYGKLRYNSSLSVNLGSESKRIMIFLVLFATSQKRRSIRLVFVFLWLIPDISTWLFSKNSCCFGVIKVHVD